MKRINYIIFLLICMIFVTRVYANSIDKITMDVYIDNNGDAHVTEEWTATLTSGTEGYKEYANLGESEIKNYRVSMNGTSFITNYFWDIDDSFSEKSYKAGLNETDDGIELCFGITKYGTNTYKMEYTITNFVVSTTDSDMIYWTLIPEKLDPKPEYVHIKIYSDFSYDYDTPVWGYGNYGEYTYVHEDGYIELIQDDKLDDDEYMVVLAKFPKGTFNTNVTLDENFEFYNNMAEEGAIAYSDRFNFIKYCLNIVLTGIMVIIQLLPTLIVIGTLRLVSSKKGYGTKSLWFKKSAKNVKKAPYFRDIPCNKDIFKTYWFACQYKLVKNKNDLLGAVLLKWLKNKNIENITVESSILKKEERAIKLLTTRGLNDREKKLYQMIRMASNDGILENNEFTKWCKKNYKKIIKWFDDVIDDITNDYINKGLIVKDKSIVWGTRYIVDNSLKNTAMQVSGLKNFLNDFSNIKDRESIEVNLWDEYLIYAQIFGIAKKVAKEFKDLYPDIINDELYEDIIFIDTISFRGVRAASSAKSMAESRARSYSSGGGGFSSGGGGGGSFGGGGGGGFR